MSEGDGALERRWVLRAGLIGAGGLGAVVGIAGLSSASVTAQPVQVLDVRAYGARGDGTTDDSHAIQAALDAVSAPAQGTAIAPSPANVVYFPAGNYLVSSTLTPKPGTLLVGTHTVDLIFTESYPSQCLITAAAGFTGSALISLADSDGRPVHGVTIRNLGLCGGGQSAGAVDGISLPAYAPSNVLQLCLEDVTIGGFSGSGIRGSLQCGTLANCHIAYNRDWGVDVSSGDVWQDAFITGCYLYFNRNGNLLFAAPGVSGQVEVLNSRFDRAGDSVDRTRGPWNATAPGVSITGASLIRFTNCATDANMGNGVQIVHEAGVSPSYVPNNIQFTNCMFTRDGSGDSTLDLAGIAVVGQPGAGSTVDHVMLVNCAVGPGFRIDSATSGPSGPRYGVLFENTRDFQWIGGNVYTDTTTFPGTQSYYTGGSTNFRPMLIDLAHGLMPLPSAAPTSSLGAVPEGYVYLDTDGSGTHRLKAWMGGAWRSVTLT